MRRRPDATAGPAGARDALWRTVGHMVQALLSRRRLAALDDRMLADIGLSRVEALREAARPAWDLAPPPRDPSRRRDLFW